MVRCCVSAAENSSLDFRPPVQVLCGYIDDRRVLVNSSEATLRLLTDGEYTEEGFELTLRQGGRISNDESHGWCKSQIPRNASNKLMHVLLQRWTSTRAKTTRASTMEPAMICRTISTAPARYTRSGRDAKVLPEQYIRTRYLWRVVIFGSSCWNLSEYKCWCFS